MHPVDDRLDPVDLIACEGSVPAPRGQGHLVERRRRRGLAEERCAGAEIRVAGIAKLTVGAETLRLDLSDLVNKGVLLKIGDKRGTRYILK